MADRFYTNCALNPGPVTIDGPEAHHLAAVCRLRPGDAVCLFNGDGHEYPAEVSEIGKRSAVLVVQTIETPNRELPFSLEIAAPLPKGDRAQFLIEKLTELGVTAFTPLQTARSVVHPRETKLDKLERYVIEASKQCGRNVLMKIGPLTTWANFVHCQGLPERRIVAHPGEPAMLPGRGPSADGVAAVGPEGGFTDEEVELARAAGWAKAGLGPRILRMETAAMMMAILAVSLNRH
jgi:16S rRNA (uracil1498-N3)-methyltransferase